jgi:uroporphyrinogen decarboxylase
MKTSSGSALSEASAISGFTHRQQLRGNEVMKNLFQKVLSKEVTPVPPIWMMRQAGRYHQHYQNLKKTNTFMDLCLKPELAAEVAMGPVEDFDFDAAILFSDILFPLKALGMPLDYTDAGPQLGFQLDAENFKRLKAPQEAALEMKFQKEALQITRARLSPSKGLIGFVGGPWTLFVYAMEGSHAGNLIRSKTAWPLWQQFSNVIKTFLIDNIRLQVQGGADVVMIFDTAAGELSPAMFQNLVQPVLTSLAMQFPKQLGYYSKGTQPAHFNQAWKQIPWLGVGVDHRFDLPEQLRKAQGFTQGNFDQSLLHLGNSDFRKALTEYLKPLQDMKPEERAGWVCGLGHGVLPKTPEQNVREFVQIVRKAFA